MNRLTKATDDLTFLCEHLRRETKFDAARIKAIHDRLAAYEDTGLEPEEVAANMEMFAAYRNVCGGLPPEEVEKLVKAQQDGRLVVLPCKVGDTVWCICEGDCYDKQAYTDRFKMSMLDANKAFDYNEFGAGCTFGKTVFLTSEEAEAAIAKENRPG